MAAPKIDLETIITGRLIPMLVANFNNKCAAITTEKNDSITLETVDSTNGYVVLDMNQKVMAFDPFIAVLVDDIQTVGQYGQSSHTVSLFVILVKADPGQDDVIYKKMLRYLRAMEEVFEEHWDELAGGVKYKIQSLAPKRLEELSSSKLFRGAGVVIDFTYTS